MTRGTAVRGLLAAMAIAVCATSASAQVFGTFSWQMQPYCNQVTLTLTSVTGNFTLDGSDDQCGAAKKGSIVGVGVFNPDGSVGLNFTIISSPGGLGVSVSANVSPANGQGTWSDDAGNSGTFAFFAATAGLPARPSAVVQFRVTGNTSLSVPNASTTTVNTWFTTPNYNVGGGSYVATAGTYTVPQAGLYLVNASIAWAAAGAATGYRCLYIYRNSGILTTQCDAPSTTASFQLPHLVTVHALNAGDVVSVRAYQSTGVAGSLASLGNESMFIVTRLR